MLTVTSKHALRALSHLVPLYPNRGLPGRELAVRANIPPNYLSKIMLTLRNQGIVSATRGTGGGYRLRRIPDQVRLIDIVEVFDGPASQPGCLLGPTHACSETDPCPAHQAWGEVYSSYVNFLHHCTLADIAWKTEESARRAAG